MPPSDLETDSTCNPFIEIFPQAVEFKIRHLLSIGFRKEQIVESIESRKHYLLDSEVEIFLYPTEKSLEQAGVIFQALAEITAILSFADRGITMFGWHFEVNHEVFRIGKLSGYQGHRPAPTTEWKLQERRQLDW